MSGSHDRNERSLSHIRGCEMRLRHIVSLTTAILGALIASAGTAGTTNAQTAPIASPATPPLQEPIPWATVFLSGGDGDPTEAARAQQHVIFVMGTGDAATRGRLIFSVIQGLRQYALKNDAQRWLIPEPEWTLSDFAKTCNTRWQTTMGALVVSVVAIANGGEDKFIYKRSTTQIAGGALYARCNLPDPLPPTSTQKPKLPNPPTDLTQTGALSSPTCMWREIFHSKAPVQREERIVSGGCLPPAPSATGSPEFSWNSGVEYATDTVKTPTLLPPLALLLSAAGIWETFAPSKTNGTVVTVSASPNAVTGAQTTVATTSQSVSNPSTLGGVAVPLYGNALTYTSGATSIPLSDEQNWRAANGIVTLLLRDMNCTLSPKPAPSPEATPARFPLLLLSKGAAAPTAPFCKQ